jgi:hypothetical protein
VREGGFEPPRLSAPPPQDGVSASSTTPARQNLRTYRKTPTATPVRIANRFYWDADGGLPGVAEPEFGSVVWAGAVASEEESGLSTVIVAGTGPTPGMLT